MAEAFSHLQVPDDAEVLRAPQAAGGGGDQPVRPADQQVTCGGVAAALRAHIGQLRQQRPHGAAQGCGEEHSRDSGPEGQVNAPILFNQSEISNFRCGSVMISRTSAFPPAPPSRRARGGNHSRLDYINSLADSRTNATDRTHPKLSERGLRATCPTLERRRRVCASMMLIRVVGAR